MRGRPAARRCVLSGALVAIVTAMASEAAVAGEYSVGNCRADRLNFNTRAFEDFVTRGMTIRRACNPEGGGPSGLITGNAVRAGQVRRGAFAAVTITAPPQTRFTTFRWAGVAERTDCRYALQLYAEVPGGRPIPMKNVRARQRCPRARRVQAAGYPSETFNIAGATRIVQRAICVGGRQNSCSARGTNNLRTLEAQVGIADDAPPSASIVGDTPLARGEWSGGIQPLNYDASDNVGVRQAKVIAAGNTGGTDERPCAFALPQEQVFADRIPCPNGPGQISVETNRLTEGTQPLVVQAQDTAGNVGDTVAVTARIDNTPPGRADVGVEGGDHWRNRNDFAVAWANPPEPDRAPIAGVGYTLCSVGAGSCSRGDQAGADISRLGIPVPEPGEWALSLWRRDAAGNQTEAATSVPVRLRYDPQPPQLAFEPLSNADPTSVAVQVDDKVSGLATGAIEISPSGSGVWQALSTDADGSRLLARIDDAALAAGGYVLRARALDRASNEASTDRRLDGEPMALTLPLRIAASLRAGFKRVRTVRRTIRRRGKRVPVRRRVTLLERATRVRSGGRALVAGRLVNRDGDGIAGAEVRVLSSSSISPEQLVAVLRTDAEGRFRYAAAGSSSRTLRFAYAGSPLVLPAERTIGMSVPAQTSLRVDRGRVLNGQSVKFRGRLRTRPAPPGGKLVELQARLSDRWQTFRTTRSDAAGRWAVPYRFKRTRGVQRFRFRARLPREVSYPFAGGGSRVVTVRVKGL